MRDQLELRPMQAADFDDEVLGWYRNDDGYLDYFSGSGVVFTRESLVQDLETGRAAGAAHYFLTLCENRRIGVVKIGPINRRHKTSDLVNLIGSRAHAGKGLGARAVRAATQIAFEELDLRRLHSGMFASNIRAIRAYVRAGWFIEATFRGFYWVDGRAEDRVCVACLNPKYFPDPDAPK